MKTLLSILLLLPLLTNGATYYFSQFTGDDTRSAAQAQNSSTPWKTLSKLTSVTLAPGDFVYLQRGGTYTGSITITTDGTNSNRITFTAYGTGAKPIITGEAIVSAWTNLGGNIWESTTAASPLSSLNMVTVNGVNTPMGRYPNTGYVTYQSHSGNTSITASGLPAATQNWATADLCIRKYRWIIERDSCTSHSGTTLNFVNGLNNNAPQDGYGVIITDHPATLDQQNEWYFNPSTRKLRIYSTSSPTNVKIATINDLFYCVQKDYITVDNINFTYANRNGVNNQEAAFNRITNCDFQYMGFMATNSRQFNPSANTNAQSQYIDNCTARECNDAGFYLSNSDDAIVRNCTADRVGMAANMGKPTVPDFAGSTFQGITADGTNALVEYNSVDSVGYIGIKTRAGATIQYNYVNYHNFVKDDGGGIYLNPLNKGVTYPQGFVRNNIVLNAVGAAAGTNSANPEGHGIYNDEAMDNTDYVNNTVAYSSSYGLFMNQNNNSNITGNVVFDAKRGLAYQKYDNTYPFAGNVITGNILVAKGLTQYPAYYEPMAGSMPAGTINNNVYAQPLDLAADVVWWDFNGGNNYGTLPEWRAASGKDATSTISPMEVNQDEIRFEFNNTQIPKTITLGANYKGVNGTDYPGSITLQPYTSMVLLLNTAGNVGPTANAGTDKVITLPVNSAAMNGSGTDPDGTIITYSWAKTAGPAGGTIANSNAAVTSASGLPQGTHTYTLTVTDNDGATDTDVMTITVNSAANQSPVSIPGANQTITLPTNTVNLVGSGTDSDGTIAGYLWTQTGGTAATITTPTTASTSITGLSTAGIRTFNLRVTDNLGATGNATLQVTVNSAIVPPTANAGTDKVITLPANSAALNGSGTGTGISYLWTKSSGPAGGAITSSTSAVTSATGLLQGVYTYELRVTDVNASFATDQMTITVNAAAPGVPPQVDAGANMTITLPLTSTVLSGSATASSGTIVSYQWTHISGGGSPVIASPAAASTNITGLTAEGVYGFRFRATDSNGLFAYDTAYVTVKAATPGTATSIKFFQAVVWPKNRINMGWDGYVTSNTKNFEVEKDFSGVFKIIGMVMPNTDPNDKDYWFTHSGVKRGTHKYRIKGNDHDGRYVYSPVVTVKKN